ncbi:hypothetical protein ACFPRL_14850 [Pseudoclavibacter helvolus]
MQTPESLTNFSAKSEPETFQPRFQLEIALMLDSAPRRTPPRAAQPRKPCSSETCVPRRPEARRPQYPPNPEPRRPRSPKPAPTPTPTLAPHAHAHASRRAGDLPAGLDGALRDGRIRVDGLLVREQLLHARVGVPVPVCGDGDRLLAEERERLDAAGGRDLVRPDGDVRVALEGVAELAPLAADEAHAQRLDAACARTLSELGVGLALHGEVLRVQFGENRIRHLDARGDERLRAHDAGRDDDADEVCERGVLGGADRGARRDVPHEVALELQVRDVGDLAEFLVERDLVAE